jgi:hypothetical protein
VNPTDALSAEATDPSLATSVLPSQPPVSPRAPPASDGL